MLPSLLSPASTLTLTLSTPDTLVLFTINKVRSCRINVKLSVKEGGGGGLLFCFLAGLEGVQKRYVWRIEANGEEASGVAMKRGEEKRAEWGGAGAWGGGVCEKMQSWRVWKSRISTYANTLRS